jgi:hypothetical protein
MRDNLYRSCFLITMLRARRHVSIDNERKKLCPARSRA